MRETKLPPRVAHTGCSRGVRNCPAHRAWVRRHHCSVQGCERLPIECAHVRRGTDGGTSFKPSDKWVVSLCSEHHREQHAIGESAFEKRHGICLRELATLFARRSPHWQKLICSCQI